MSNPWRGPFLGGHPVSTPLARPTVRDGLATEPTDIHLWIVLYYDVLLTRRSLGGRGLWRRAGPIPSPRFQSRAVLNGTRIFAKYCNENSFVDCHRILFAVLCAVHVLLHLGDSQHGPKRGQQMRADIDDITDCFATSYRNPSAIRPVPQISPVRVMPGIRQLNRSVLCRKKNNIISGPSCFPD